MADHEICIGKFSRSKNKFFKCPNPKHEDEFLNFLQNLANKQLVNGWVVFPTNDETMWFLSKNKEKLEQYFGIPTPKWSVTKYLYDKSLTYKIAGQLEIDIPRTWYATSLKELAKLDVKLPVIIKPAIKDHFYPTTNAKALLAEDKTELARAFQKTRTIIDPSEIMIQEVIPGGATNLYSFCSLFKNGKVLAKLMGRRARQHPMDFGHASTFVETVDIPEIEEASVRLLKEIDYYGLSEVEFKYDERDLKYKLLEVNARTWGWHTLGLAAGVNFPHLLFQDLTGQKASANSYKKDVKWVRLLTDFPTATSEIFKRNMSLSSYCKSLKGKKEFAVFSWRDPLPFLVELFLLPYLWRKRGF